MREHRWRHRISKANRSALVLASRTVPADSPNTVKYTPAPEQQRCRDQVGAEAGEVALLMFPRARPRAFELTSRLLSSRAPWQAASMMRFDTETKRGELYVAREEYELLPPN